MENNNGSMAGRFNTSCMRVSACRKSLGHYYATHFHLDGS